MKKFKEYEKEYEDLINVERSLKMVPLEKVSNTLGLTNFQYTQMFQKFGRDMYITIFDLILKFAWLNTRFNYNNYGIGTDPHGGMNYLRRNFSIFSRNYIGLDFSPIAIGFFPSRLMSYFKELFPLFDVENPFENPEYFKFPYQHVTPDLMLLVYQMPERLNLLEIAEKRKMNYVSFYNYVVNYVCCYNAEKGKEIFGIKYDCGHSPDYITYKVKKKPHRVVHDRRNVSKRLIGNVGNQ